MKNEIGFISEQIASLLDLYEDQIQYNGELVKKIHMHRKSLEFFLCQGEESRALYEAVNCHAGILDFLDVIEEDS